MRDGSEGNESYVTEEPHTATAPMVKQWRFTCKSTFLSIDASLFVQKIKKKVQTSTFTYLYFTKPYRTSII